MVHFSGFARKMNHLPPFCASEASAKAYFLCTLEFYVWFQISNLKKKTTSC
ncbi:MAG: hypothetical protein U5L45_03715 [Saprospiraceae bacterium]|nr:hypothetical protein [Saprospiraceae bacterium]